MIERVILMCAGRAERWGNHLGVPKHLIPIDGEVLLDRTLRLVRRHTDGPITIVAFNAAYDRPGHERFEPSHGPQNFCDTDKFLSSQERWSETGTTVLLYGDVFFTDAAMKTILAHHGTHQFFGRRDRSHFSGCPWGEIFALSFPADQRDWLRSQMLHIKSLLLAGEITSGGGWELYKRLHAATANHFTTIDDFTEDFDFPHDFERWHKRYRNPLRRLLIPLYSPLAKTWRRNHPRPTPSTSEPATSASMPAPTHR